MVKKIILRSLFGIVTGITMGYIVTIIISLVFANGYYSPCVPALIEQMGSEIGAVILQTILCAVLGMTFSSASIIWEVDKWSIAKQTGIYFLIIACVMLPIAYFTYWMEHTFLGIILYIGIFILIFVVVWILQYLIWKKKIDRINKKIC